MPVSIVECCICGEEWDAMNPGVEYRSLDLKWWCADETECTSRRAKLESAAEELRVQAAMYRGLAQAFGQLETGGWNL